MVSECLLISRLADLANREFEIVKTWVEELSQQHRVAFLIEVCRTLDLQHVLQHFSKNPRNKLPCQDFDIMVRGWNSALGLLLSEPTTFKGIPIVESTNASRSAAMGILHQLGRSALLQENIKMIEAGMAEGCVTDNGITLRMSERVRKDHFLDRLEVDKLKKVQSGIPNGRTKYLDGYLLADIDSRLERLAFPWNTGKGVMIGYGAEPEVDKHFLALVTENTLDWRDEAGIHPEAQIENVSGSTLASLGLLLISWYLRHIRFVDVGKRKVPEANYAMSLTIWKSASELRTSICSFTGISEAEIAAALDLFTVTAEQHVFFQAEQTPFIPMLIEVSDGYLLAPVSSIFRNPFRGVRRLQEHRSDKTQISLRQPREAWMISDLRHLFLGNRYEVVDIPTVLKRDNNTLTDIDAAVLDRTTGELGLFQLKWQDFDTNEVRIQRSKAKNFVGEVDAWSDKVLGWLEQFGVEQLCRCLRLKMSSSMPVSNIRLFAIGKSASRFQSYGYEVKSRELAVCNWAQFVRLRYEIGPAKSVIGALHQQIREEEAYPVPMKPLPHEIIVAGQRVVFENLWNEFEDEELE